MRLIAGVFVLAFAAGCATPAPEGAAKVAAAAPAKPVKVAAKEDPSDPNRKVCRRSTPTGSNMPQRTCATAAEWDKRDADNLRKQDEVNRMIRDKGGIPES